MTNRFFPEIHGRFGFGCMRLPMIGKDVDLPQYCEMVDAFLDAGVGHVVVKVGRRGCLFRSREESFCVAPHLVDPVDTTGAGDNFCAGFVCGLVEGHDHRECCRFANAAASICIQHDGASTGITSRAQLQEVLDSY